MSYHDRHVMTIGSAKFHHREPLRPKGQHCSSRLKNPTTQSLPAIHANRAHTRFPGGSANTAKTDIESQKKMSNISGEETGFWNLENPSLTESRYEDFNVVDCSAEDMKPDAEDDLESMGYQGKFLMSRGRYKPRLLESASLGSLNLSSSSGEAITLTPMARSAMGRRPKLQSHYATYRYNYEASLTTDSRSRPRAAGAHRKKDPKPFQSGRRTNAWMIRMNKKDKGDSGKFSLVADPSLQLIPLIRTDTGVRGHRGSKTGGSLSRKGSMHPIPPSSPDSDWDRNPVYDWWTFSNRDFLQT